MPVYEYYCSDCHNKFETLRSMAAANDPVECSSCGATKHVNRTISTFARTRGSAADAWNSGESGGSASMPDFGSGGCCGGGCGCH